MAHTYIAVIKLQFCVTFITAIFTALITALISGTSDQAAVISALLGGLCCAIPNSLFALRLYMGTKKPGGANPLLFFVGHFLKLLITVALLVAVVCLYHDLNWIAFLVVIVVVNLSYLLTDLFL